MQHLRKYAFIQIVKRNINEALKFKRLNLGVRALKFNVQN